MLRVFISEGLSADYIWRLTPPDMRNTRSIMRPWNYIQAAIGREVDRMVFEETGIRRVPPPRPRRTSNNSDNNNDDDNDEDDSSESDDVSSEDAVRTPADLTVRELQEIARITQNRSREVQATIIDHTGQEQVQRDRWRQTRQDWARELRDAYAVDTGTDMPPTNNPVVMLRILWRSQNVQNEDETVDEYVARANWNAWNMFARQAQVFLRELEAELEAIEALEEL
ncbi:uncharacterized protein Z520_06801 [Fonsecaea multimorphosa CBS 102226]|uniref:Uncharacterized protein n=1 Tax=Fonsecaea multimorphosa CBS 102226 TaxID=1442371 RepID=A0A0D2K2P2_9EURO|nr:uncharacterized protein Z520_06801 [Fonsecaea multimorphosa CBS 102226]KIX97349.1 hypothetical protein Z520_06801 [Fonsecaea multimorphosa CBS 102226]OAL23316.1 hypothetical protein AYO22_06366 [Fonsecaea multimorphosa]